MKKGITAAIIAVLFIAICMSPVYTLGMQTEENSGVLTAGYEKSLEKVGYSTEYEYSNEMTEGVSALISQGSTGLKENVAYVVRKNGIIVTSRTIADLTIKESVNEVIIMGTAKRTAYASGNQEQTAAKVSSVSYDGPIKQGTGSFINPLATYKFGSKFGMRNGRMHLGVDLLAPAGTDIHAADSGTVVFTGYRNSYGLLVIIEHGNGFTTYYSHCSSVSVNAGDDVVKGQKIADVGRTGNATGTHVHFEVRANGVCVNPANYISIAGVSTVTEQESAAEEVTSLPETTPILEIAPAQTTETAEQLQTQVGPENPPVSPTPEAISPEALSVTTETLDNAE